MSPELMEKWNAAAAEMQRNRENGREIIATALELTAAAIRDGNELPETVRYGMIEPRGMRVEFKFTDGMTVSWIVTTD